MKSIKIAFVDGYDGFKPSDSFLFGFLQEKFGAKLSDDPDYILCQPFGFDHHKYEKPIKIFFTGENVIPDFNFYDYAIGFDHLEFGDRFLRVPLYAVRKSFMDFRNSVKKPTEQELLNRAFCSFVVTNGIGASPIRQKFFHELSKYKRIDSGGRYLNNIGGPIKDKQAFVRAHKFNIAFENSSHPGYVTEKIVDSLAEWSVPIYWGDPLVTTDFRAESFVRVQNENDIERAIDEIIKLDTDDDLYLKKCLDSCLVEPCHDYIKALEQFFNNIFSQDLDKARRVTQYGHCSSFFRPSIRKSFAISEKIECPIRFMRTLYHGFFR